MLSPANQSTNRGVALLEVLIAIIVFSIGLLGLAGLNIAGLRNNHNAYIHTQATQRTYDLADRMRVNVAAAVAGDYIVSAAPSPEPSFDCMTNFTGTETANRCSSTEIAAADLTAWYKLLDSILPSGSGEISCADSDTTDGDTCTRGSVHRITITWNEQKADNPPTEQTFILDIRP